MIANRSFPGQARLRLVRFIFLVFYGSALQAIPSATQSASAATVGDLDPAMIEEDGAVTLPFGQRWMRAVTAHPDQSVFGFAGGNGPSRMVYFNRERMTLVGEYPFPDAPLEELVAAPTDPDGDYPYSLSDNNPVRGVRLLLSQSQLLVSEDRIDFVDAEVGQAARPATITVENLGAGPASGLSSSLQGEGFGILSNDCPETLPIDASCSVEVYFAPNEVGPAEAVLTINAADTGPLEVMLVGLGQPPNLSMHRREATESEYEIELRPGYLGRAFDAAGYQAGALTWTGGDLLANGQPDPEWGVFEYSRRFDPQFSGGALVPASVGMRARDGVNSTDFYQAFLGIVEPTGALIRVDRGPQGDQDVLTLPQTDGPVTSVAIDPSDEFVLFTTAGDSGYLAEVSNQPFELIRSAEISATAGIGAMLVDDAFQTAWLAVNSTPPRLVEVRLDDLSTGAELELTGVDPSVDMARRVSGASTAYFVTSSEPGRIIRVDLELMSITGEMTLDAASGNALDIEVALNGDTLYLSGNRDGSGIVTQVDFPSRSVTGRYYMGPSDGSAGGPLLDESEQLLYVPVTGGAFRLVHFDLAGPELRFEPESLQFYQDPDLPGSGPPKTATVELINAGDSVATALGMFLPDERFAFDAQCGETLEPGARCTITVQYDPFTPGSTQTALHAHSGENVSGSLRLLVGEDVRYFRDRFQAQ